MSNTLPWEAGGTEKDEVTQAEKVDIELGHRLASKKETPWAKGLGAIGKLGDQEPLYVMGFACLVAGAIIRDPRLRLAGVSVVAHVAAADLAKQAVKSMVTRTRPHVLMEDGHYEAEMGEGGGGEESPVVSLRACGMHTSGCVRGFGRLSDCKRCGGCDHGRHWSGADG